MQLGVGRLWRETNVLSGIVVVEDNLDDFVVGENEGVCVGAVDGDVGCVVACG